MTTHTTILVLTHDSNDTLARLKSLTEMPPVATIDPALSVLSNSANSIQRSPSSVELPRKSHDKTISGVFTYTNGSDTETGYSDHRLEQIRDLKNNSLRPLGGQGTVPNGPLTLSSRIVKGGTANTASYSGRARSHSKDESVHSVNSSVATDRYQESSAAATSITRNTTSSDGDSRVSTVENVSAGTTFGMPSSRDGASTKRNAPELLRTQTDGNRQQQVAALSATSRDLENPRTLSQGLDRPPVHRFSSPPAMTAVQPSMHERPTEHPALEPPRLTQRHNLQVPRGSGQSTRGSRDFSFSAGDEVLASTGRFSPTRDNHDSSVPRHRRPSFGLARKTTRSMASDAHLDEVLPDEDAARWTEVIKQKRASRRKRRDEEDDDRVIVGKKVEEGHVNWVTAYNMLTGIRFTVSRTNAKMDRELTDADFEAKHKFSFDITGNELTPSAKYDFKFKDYSPWVFRRLRAIFGLDPADYLMSLTSKYILSELGSPGKSGSFFYFSRDYKYIIKTIHHAEHKLLRKILKEYYNHVKDNPNTLISQFYGLHRVKIPYGRKIHFVVMNNLFPPHRDIHQTFDLKGSTIGRDFREEELEANPRATLKDLNWLRRDLHLEFQESIKRAFIDQITRDVSLLQRLHIMDYSLLVGMHDLEKGNEENVRETTLQVFQPGGERDADDIALGNMLIRTPSRLENARKARELRQTLKKEKPTPMSLVQAKMPDEMKSSDRRNRKLFYSDDGGIQASHEDGSLGDQVYYLGVIDCLTHYGFVKRLEHFWKGMSSPSTQISPIPPEAYGERFVNFITGISMTKEEAGRRTTLEIDNRESLDAHNALHHHHLPSPVNTNLDGAHPNEKHSPMSPLTMNSTTVDKTMQRAQTQADKLTGNKTSRESEESLPERTLRSTSAHDGDGREPRNSTTLPVVEEVGEGNSDISRSVSREKPEPTITKTTTGLRKMSASKGRRSSEEHAKRLILSPQSGQDICDSPVEYSEEARLAVNNAFRRIPTDNLSPTDSMAGTKQDKPPRLGSGLIPHLEPMYASLDALDPSHAAEAADESLERNIYAR